MDPRAFLVAILAIAAPSCTSSPDPTSDADTDREADADADVDADADADADADTDAEESEEGGRDAEADSEAETPLTWNEIAVPTGLFGHLARYSLWVGSDAEVFLCIDASEDTKNGGIVRLDGESFAIERSEFICSAVWGQDPDHIWAIGHVDPWESRASVLLRREGAEWVEEPVASSLDCTFLTMFEGLAGAPALVGSCPSADVDEYRLWTWTPEAKWQVDASGIVLPETSLIEIRGGFAASAELVFYGSSGPAGSAIVTSTGDDLGFTGEHLLWAEGTPDGGIVATDGASLQIHAGDSWSETAPCPATGLPGACWNTGDLSSTGEVYLAGGIGCSGDSGSDDLRLYRWNGESLTRLLEPCGGEKPHCGIYDVETTEARLYAMIGRNRQYLLIWAELPR